MPREEIDDNESQVEREEEEEDQQDDSAASPPSSQSELPVFIFSRDSMHTHVLFSCFEDMQIHP